MNRAGPALRIGGDAMNTRNVVSNQPSAKQRPLLRFDNAVQAVFAVMVLPGWRDSEPINDDNQSLDNSFAVPAAPPADVPAALRRRPTRPCGAAVSGGNGRPNCARVREGVSDVVHH